MNVTITQVMAESTDILVTAEREVVAGEVTVRQVVQIRFPAADIAALNLAQKRAYIAPLLRTAFTGPAAPTQQTALLGPVTLP